MIGFADEIAAWKRADVACVISLLERSESAELELEREDELCRASGIAFRSFPIVDRGLPASMREVELLCREINEVRSLGQRVAVHCRAGIGRSSLIAASSLVVCGVVAVDAFEMISTVRGLKVPDTPEQVAWVARFAKWPRAP